MILESVVNIKTEGLADHEYLRHTVNKLLEVDR